MATRFTDDQLGELLELLRGADSVELKLAVPEHHQRSTIDALGMDPMDAQIRQVPKAVPERVRRLPGFSVEVDAMPGGYVCSASFKHVRRRFRRAGDQDAAGTRVLQRSPRGGGARQCTSAFRAMRKPPIAPTAAARTIAPTRSEPAIRAAT